MSQFDPVIGADKTGLQYRTDDNAGKKALLNHHKGSTAPTYAEAGITWLDDSGTPWLFKVYDGTDWITMGSVNATSNAFTPFFGAAALQAASTTVAGLVERATDAEASTGTDTTRYITPKQLADNSGQTEQSAVQSTTSGAFVDFTGIPSGVKRVTVHLKGVSTNSTGVILIQIGDSGGIETTGYDATASTLSAASTAATAYTTGFGIFSASSAAVEAEGIVTLTLSDGTWFAESAVKVNGSPTHGVGSGNKTLSSELTQVRISGNGGTFDNGSAQISWGF